MNQEELIRFGTGRQLTEIDYLSELLSYQASFRHITSVNHLITQVVQTINLLNQGYLPATLPILEVTEEMITATQSDVLRRFPQQPTRGNALWAQLRDDLENIDFLVHHLRDALIEYFSMYGYVSTPFIQDLSRETAGQPVLELMAGHGYLSAGLRAIDPKQIVFATDNQTWRNQPDITLAEPVTTVENMTALAALAKYGETATTIIMSWAPDTTQADWDVLQTIRSQYTHKRFIIIGEPNGATNSQQFWSQAKLTPILSNHHQSFDLINEQVFEVE